MLVDNTALNKVIYDPSVVYTTENESGLSYTRRVFATEPGFGTQIGIFPRRYHYPKGSKMHDKAGLGYAIDHVNGGRSRWSISIDVKKIMKTVSSGPDYAVRVAEAFDAVLRVSIADIASKTIVQPRYNQSLLHALGVYCRVGAVANAIVGGHLLSEAVSISNGWGRLGIVAAIGIASVQCGDRLAGHTERVTTPKHGVSPFVVPGGSARLHARLNEALDLAPLVVALPSS